MEQIVRADIAAFGQGRSTMANAMIEQSGVRIGEDRRRGRGAGVNPSGRFEPSPAMSSTTAGNRSRNCRPSRPRCRSRSRAPSSPATSRPTSPSTARSTPIAAASMAASTASRGRRHAYMGLSPGLDFESKLFAKPDAAKLLEQGARQGRLPAAHHRHRHQHRSLPADREAIPDHARDAGSAGSARAIRSAS